jgi:hypothetical protein
MHRTVTHSAIVRAFMDSLKLLILAPCDRLDLVSFNNAAGEHRIVTQRMRAMRRPHGHVFGNWRCV